MEGYRVPVGRDPPSESKRTSFASLLPLVPAMVWCADRTGRLLFASEYYAEFAARPPEQLLDYGWTDLVHVADLPELLGDFRAAVMHDAPFEARYRMRRGDGAYRLVLSRGTPINDEDGRLRWYVGSTTDLGDLEPAGTRSTHREATYMCDNCVRVQDNEGNWHQPREFVLRHWPISLKRCPTCSGLEA